MERRSILSIWHQKLAFHLLVFSNKVITLLEANNCNSGQSTNVIPEFNRSMGDFGMNLFHSTNPGSKIQGSREEVIQRKAILHYWRDFVEKIHKLYPHCNQCNDCFITSSSETPQPDSHSYWMHQSGAIHYFLG